MIKKETLEYLHGERNAVQDEFILSREQNGEKELVYVSLPYLEEPIYALWTKKRRRKLKFKNEDKEETNENASTTGGKKQYVMITEDREKALSFSLEATGLLMKLAWGGFIEWHTGRLVHGRHKKAMTFSDMSKSVDVGKVKLRALLSELSKVIRYDRSKRAYFVDRQWIRKGARS